MGIMIKTIINGIMAPDKMLEEPAYIWIYEKFHMTSVRPLIMLLLVSLIVVYVIKNAFLIYMYNKQYKFIFENQRVLADRMVKCYMSQPYLFHVSKNSAELLRNINEDTGNFFGALQAGITAAAKAAHNTFLLSFHPFWGCKTGSVIVTALSYPEKSFTCFPPLQTENRYPATTRRDRFLNEKLNRNGSITPAMEKDNKMLRAFPFLSFKACLMEYRYPAHTSTNKRSPP